MQTANLIIRRFNDKDFNDFAGLILDKMSSKYSIYDEQFPTDDDSLKTILHYFSTSDEFYAIELKTTAKVIGFVTLNNCEKHDVKNLGYCIHTQYQGKGYGTEAVKRIIQFAREELNLNKLITGTAKNNIPSIQLLSKMGFCKVDESIMSFARDENDKQIEFISCSFELVL